MNKIFVDTAGWANFFDKDEPFHHLTRTIYEKARNIWNESGHDQLSGHRVDLIAYESFSYFPTSHY